MNPISIFLHRCGGWLRRGRVKREIDEELRFHIEMRTAENVAAGMAPEEAAREARKRFGNVQSIREECREAKGASLGESMLQDIRFAWRMLGKNPRFSAIVILTLGIGIGSNTAIFSLVNAVMLRALPYPDSDRLAQVLVSRPKPYPDDIVWAPETFVWQKNIRVFSQFGVYRESEWTMTGGGEAERLVVGDVSSGFLPALGVQPALGRIFTEDEDKPGNDHQVAILSYGLWQRRFGGDTNVVGRTITIADHVHTIIGVLPASFQAPLQIRYYGVQWDVLRALKLGATRYQGDLFAFGRLNPGITPEQARVELDTLYDPFRDPVRKDRVAVLPLQHYLAAHTRFNLLLYQGAVGFLLLIACANVANLLLARATGRQREIAVRLALGASRFRIIRQLLTESVLLALLGSILGLLLAFGIKDAVRALLPALRNLPPVAIDGRVLAFTFLAALLTGLLFGLAPALRASRVELVESLKEGSRSVTGERRHHRLQGMLVIAEVAIALVLVVGAGLLIKCFCQARSVDPGFRTDHLLTMKIEINGLPRYASVPAQTAFLQKAIEELRSLPGVERVGADEAMPLVGPWEGTKYWAEVEGRTNLVLCGTVNPDYFRALGIPLKKGRGFTEEDRTGAPAVVLVNESFVRSYMPGKDPAGQQIRCGDEKDDWNWKTVVGMVGDVRKPPSEASPRVYFCYLQRGDIWGMGFALRTQVDPMTLAAAARARIRSLDPDLVVAEVKTMEKHLWESLGTQRMNMWLSGTVGALALGLAAIGIFGVMSFTFAQRTHEIGVRMALGAQARDVLRQVLWHGLKLTVSGALLGLAAALGLTRLLSSQLYGVSALDPLSFAGASVFLGAVAMLACYLLARRATKVTPMTALRYE